MWEKLLLPTMLLPCYYCHIITAHVVTAMLLLPRTGFQTNPAQLRLVSRLRMRRRPAIEARLSYRSCLLKVWVKKQNKWLLYSEVVGQPCTLHLLLGSEGLLVTSRSVLQQDARFNDVTLVAMKVCLYSSLAGRQGVDARKRGIRQLSVNYVNHKMQVNNL